TMAADGADQTRLTRTEVGDSIDPRWSPDGSQIVFVRVPSGGDGDGPQQIWVVDASGRPGWGMTTRSHADMSFTSMTAEDIDAVVLLEQGAFADPWNTRDFVSELKNPRSNVQLLRNSRGTLLGHVVFWVVLDQVEVLDIAVAIEHRRQGYGRLLMEHVVAMSQKQGCNLISLEVRRSNEAAMALYEGMGFLPVAVRPKYYAHDNEDAIVMQRSIEAIHGESHGI
ncbi:MAG TPA: ribosomal-protein-alanine N-acetyltransferase, partial [Myxococcales bacterium]|nr:ribosomal-protein-alanine N-acetyltransferase [Myxococcales bacterium]